MNLQEIVIAIVSGLLVHELNQLVTLVCRGIIGISVMLLPDYIKERYHEEWPSGLEEYRGNISKFWFSINLLIAAKKIEIDHSNLIEKNFSWNYLFQPNPGCRYWRRDNKDWWIEYYPCGLETRYVVVNRTTKNDIEGEGLIVQKSDPGVIQQQSDGSFTKVGDLDSEIQVFIPGREVGERKLLFRHKFDGEWQDWKCAGTIIDSRSEEQ